MDQLELLATAIVAADTWTPRRWLAKYGAINTVESTHLNRDYKTARDEMLAQLAEQSGVPDSSLGLTEHSLNF